MSGKRVTGESKGSSEEVTLGRKKYTRPRISKGPRWDQAEGWGQEGGTLLESLEGPEKSGKPPERERPVLMLMLGRE